MLRCCVSLCALGALFALTGMNCTAGPSRVIIDISSASMTTDGSVTIEVIDDGGLEVDFVKFLHNRRPHDECPDTGAPSHCTWSVSRDDNGTHGWQALAYDMAGNVWPSNVVEINVNIADDPNASPPPPYIEPELVWGDALGLDGDDRGWSVAIDENGNAFLAGTFNGTTDLGCGPMTSAGGFDAFAAKFSPTGTCLWSRRFGDFDNYDEGRSIGIDSSGNVVMAGYFNGTVDFGTGPVVNDGLDAYVVKLSGADGQTLWAQALQGSGNDLGRAVTVSDQGDVVVVGSFVGTLDPGVDPLNAVGTDIFIAKYSGSGQPLWAIKAEAFNASSVAVDQGGNIFVAGYFSGTANFGGADHTSEGQFDAFVAKYDPSGNHLWSRQLGGSDYDEAYSVAIQPNGNVVVGGYFIGSAAFGAGTLQSQGAKDMFIVAYSPTGAPQWSQTFGAARNDYVRGIATGRNGHVFVTGELHDTVDFGNGPITADRTNSEHFVLELSSTGESLWSTGFGDSGANFGKAIAAHPVGGVVTTGFFNCFVDFGEGRVSNVGSFDASLVHFR